MIPILFVLYLLVGVAVAVAIRFLQRPVPLVYPLVLWLLPIVFALPVFFTDRTVLPADHEVFIAPWNTLCPVERHNANLNDIATQMAPWAEERAGFGITAVCLLAIGIRSSRKVTSRNIVRFVSWPWARSRGSRRGLRKPWIWLAGATVVLITGLYTSRMPLPGSLLNVPATPLDLTNPRLARLWNFLVEVRDRVPEGASYTLLAPDLDDEMYLYMFSLGILHKQVALPSSYFGEARPEGAQARYVLSYGGDLLKNQGAHLVFRARDGAVFERRAGRR